jgi:protein-tyrosine phosphatase
LQRAAGLDAERSPPDCRADPISAIICLVSNWFRTYGFAEILPSFVVGAYPVDADDVAMLDWMGVQRVLNLVEDGEYGPSDREIVQRAFSEAGIKERRIRLTDFGGVPFTAFDLSVSTINGWLDEGLTCYVHCRAGWQRSATIAAAVVAVRQNLQMQDALDFVKRAKPSAQPLEHQREDLLAWFTARGGDETPPAPSYG